MTENPTKVGSNCLALVQFDTEQLVIKSRHDMYLAVRNATAAIQI